MKQFKLELDNFECKEENAKQKKRVLLGESSDYTQIA